MVVKIVTSCVLAPQVTPAVNFCKSLGRSFSLWAWSGVELDGGDHHHPTPVTQAVWERANESGIHGPTRSVSWKVMR